MPNAVQILGAAWCAGALLFAGSLIGIFFRKIKTTIEKD